jgi:hypothetical protein
LWIVNKTREKHWFFGKGSCSCSFTGKTVLFSPLPSFSMFGEKGEPFVCSAIPPNTPIEYIRKILLTAYYQIIPNSRISNPTIYALPTHNTITESTNTDEIHLDKDSPAPPTLGCASGDESPLFTKLDI